jgi:hypothetical protein
MARDNVAITKVDVTPDPITSEAVVEPGLTYEDGGDHTNTIPWAHAYGHKGERWHAQASNTAVASSGTLRITVVVPADINFHTVAEVTAGGDAKLIVTEGAGGLSAGTAITAYNINREETAASVGTFTKDQTGVVTGTDITSGGFIIVGGAGGNSPGGTGGNRDEFILKESTTYLYEVTNLSATPQPIGMVIDFYTHTKIPGVA